MPPKKRNRFSQMFIRLYNFFHAPSSEEKLYLAVTRLKYMIRMDDIRHGRDIQYDRHNGILNPGCPPNTPEDEYVTFVLYGRDYDALQEASQSDENTMQKSLHLSLVSDLGRPPIKRSKSLKRRVLNYVQDFYNDISERQNFDSGRRLSKRLMSRSSRSSRKEKVSFKSEEYINSAGSSLALSNVASKDRNSSSSYATAFTHLSKKSSSQFKPTEE